MEEQFQFTEVEPVEHVIEQGEDQADDLGSLFGEKAPTDAELRGEEEATKAKVKPKEATKADIKPAASQKPLQEEAPPDPELESLPKEIEAIQREEAKFREFKVLSDDEYDELVEDDPTEALKYSYRLQKYEKFIERKGNVEALQGKANSRLHGHVQSAVEQIKAEVPGIYDEGSEVGSQLATFAEEMGFDSAEHLEAMTNPSTIIVPPGADRGYVLGPGAAGLVKLINRFFQAKGGKTARPAGKAPSKATVGGSGILTEADWAKLPEADKDRLLRFEE